MLEWSNRGAHPSLPPGAEVRGWLHEVPVSPELTLWLFATTPDSGAQLAPLYRRRSDVEADIRDLKQARATDPLAGHGPAMVEKELVLGRWRTIW